MLLKNVKIINHNSIINNADVLIENGIISKITHLKGESNLILIPGFIDVHIHGFEGKDNMDSKEAVESIALGLKRVGTTSFLPTVMTDSLEKLSSALRNISLANSKGANILGAHMEGPFISHEKKGAHDERFLLKPTEKLIDQLYDASNGFLKKITIAPELFTEELIKHLKDKDIVISIGHTNGSSKDVTMAASAGATSCTHLWNAMTGIVNRAPGIVEGVLLSKDIFAEIIVDLIHVDKEAIDLSIKSKGVSKIIATTDALKASYTPDGDSISGGLKVTKKGFFITLKGTNTLAGSVITMYECFKNLISLGYNIMDVVAMTSYNAAKNLNVNIGEIREGLQADLIVMDENYNIQKVYVKGE